MNEVTRVAILRTLNGPADYTRPSETDILRVKSMIAGHSLVPGLEPNGFKNDLKVLAIISVMAQELRQSIPRTTSREDFVEFGFQALCNALNKSIHRTIALDIMLDELFRQLSNLDWY